MRRLVRLSGLERTLLLQAFALLWLYRLLLWVVPFWLLTRRRVGNKPRPRFDATPSHITWAIVTASPFVPQATCLVRALAGVQLFADRGYCVRLIIGARKRLGIIEAHAWLECSSQIVLGNLDDLQSYQPLSRPEGC